jgi:hypothetical protein
VLIEFEEQKVHADGQARPPVAFHSLSLFLEITLTRRVLFTPSSKALKSEIYF